MANLTVFQRLGQLFNGGNVNSYNIHKNPDDDVIIKTTSKEEYDLATMQARQQHLLAKQWRRAQYDVENRSIAGLNEIKLMYREVDLMDLFPEIGTALDVVTEECTYINDGGSVLNITSGSERIKSILQDLFVNRLSINTMLPMICRGMCKYGNDFLLLNMDAQNGVTGWKELPVYEMERYESGMDNPYITAFNSNEILDPYTKNGTKFVWVGNTEYIPYRDWQIAHFRLLYNSLFLPYGVSFLHKARRHFRLLSMMEDSMLVYRLERAVERRVFKINVGSIDEADVPSYVQNIANEFKRTPIVDPMTGQIDLRKNILPVWKNTPIPLLDGRIITIEDLAKEYNDGKTNFVYSIQDNSLQLVPGKVVWCGKNYTAEKMVKVTLDDDSYMVMAPEHEILMRDGSKKRADEVTVGESVIPFYKEIDKNAKKRIEKYEKVYNPNSGKYEYTHRMIANEVMKGFEKYNTVHHIDFNKYNNNPNNLLWCDFNEHRSMHVELNKQRESYKAMQPYNHSELHKQHDEIRRQNKIDFWQNGNTARAKRRMTVAFDDYIWDNIRNAVLSNTVYNRLTMLNYINTSLINHLLEINTNKRLHNLKSISREVLEARVHEQGFNTITEYINSIKKNHKVKAVEFVDGDDVYCMTVVGLNGEEDRHNFALMTFKGNGEWNDSGCFVKNCNTEDFFIPVRSDSAPNPIETLPAAQNLTAIDDIKFIQNKVFTALRVPKSFLNFEEAQGDGKNLSLLDVRFSKTVNRIQQALLMELNKIAIIHLILLGFTDDLTNFNITMNNPSSQAEMLELENLAKKITTAKDAISDAGNGIPLMSVTRALKTILKWSDKEISDNLEELRLERALTAELERTSQIIKRTGIFDPVDNIYGEPGAEYSEQPMEGEDGDFGGNGGGGPVGGGAPIGGGEIDFGDEGDVPEGIGDEANVGEEGEMGVEETSNEDNATQGESNNNLGESYMRKLLNETLQKQKKVSMDLEKRRLHYADLLKKKINEDNELLKNKNSVEKVPLYNKNFFVNERLDSLQKQLEVLVENNQEI